MTVKTRITLFIVGAGLISSLLFSMVVFYELIEQPFEMLDSALEEDAHKAAEMLVKSRKGSDQKLMDAAFSEINRHWIEIMDQNSQKMLFQSDLAQSIPLLPVKPGASAIYSVIVPQDHLTVTPGQDGGRNDTFRVRTFKIALNGGIFIVKIGRSMKNLKEEIKELIFGIAVGLVVSTLALIFISRFLAGKILRPIGRMKRLAQDISEKNLDQRIPVEKGRDEFNELAKTINQMLDRLQYSFVRQRNFLFDTSHELKTPLTTIRLAVDEIFAADGENFPPFVKENFLRLSHQALRMERLVKDLLNLSSLEMITRIDAKPVPIGELISSLAEEYQFLADARQIKMNLRLPNGLMIPGDWEKLHRAFSNILDNAVKFNYDGGRIELTGTATAAELTVTVANTGPGVAEAEIPKVFDQFYRVEKSRSIQHGGSGLGLAIVKRIIMLHGGRVIFESQPDVWTRITVFLPMRLALISE